MIKRKTVLILGAGASKPYKFPLGADLKSEILTSPLSGAEKQKMQSCKSGLSSPQLHTEFLNALWRSSAPSIDAFLENRREFIEIGKFAIARALVPYEDETKLLTSENSWYQYLRNKMNAPPDRFTENEVSIITFNYDRSFEHYFHTTLMNDFGLSETQAATLMDSMPIVHVHGKLGPVALAGYKCTPL